MALSSDDEFEDGTQRGASSYQSALFRLVGF